MWQLGYGDDMDPDRCPSTDFNTPDAACDGCEPNTDSDTDDTYTAGTSSDEEALDDIFSELDDDESVASVELLPCTPHDMPMLECRALNLLQMRYVQQS
jgi:hypothetical protein